MRLAHVSDLHLVEHEDGAGASPLAVARAIAEDIAAIRDALDLVVVSGDLTDRAEPAAFAAFEDIFAAIGLPLITIPGNHDGPAGMHAYTATSDRFAGWHITNRVVEHGALRFLGLDSCLQDTTEGALDQDALDILEAEVTRRDAPPLVIVMHHPPLLLGLKRFDGFCELEGHDRLMGILRAADAPITVLSGHVHRPYTVQEGRITCHVAGSMVAPYDSPLPFGDSPIRPTTPQDFYYIHDIEPGGAHVVTPQRVRGLAP
ncbi:hypothetical protein GQ651_18560 [Alphaproteobacteria bacterium GH1-50]|uniref:Calcineurin-like phosphoesterase domain-containing protein n=1 Tax=Kangsaoukella pontilimi TaxID=2691042 RepID=A0A7C9MD26_9RHOB|nr:metallophosphoesterase [Kangsaoukella pontilimi]MXQ09853.1 hypothetical protein [Kangsaoukella pontilimi]